MKSVAEECAEVGRVAERLSPTASSTRIENAWWITLPLDAAKRIADLLDTPPELPDPLQFKRGDRVFLVAAGKDGPEGPALVVGVHAGIDSVEYLLSPDSDPASVDWWAARFVRALSAEEAKP